MIQIQNLYNTKTQNMGEHNTHNLGEHKWKKHKKKTNVKKCIFLILKLGFSWSGCWNVVPPPNPNFSHSPLETLTWVMGQTLTGSHYFYF
jgi:hypothetical protein